MQADPLLDLTSCESEPIHLSGAIQPHGVLFAASAGDLRITAVSANAGLYCGATARDLLGLPLRDVLTAAAFAGINQAGGVPDGGRLEIPRLTFAMGAALPWRALLHGGPDGIILEAELLPDHADSDTADHFSQFQSVSQQLMADGETPGVLQHLVDGVRRFTGYGRVMLYRFAGDWSGEVVAESVDASMPSYLGLHFPASDIPAQARALYTRNLDRQIPDVSYVPVPLLQIPDTQKGEAPLDLSPVGLRSVSPTHIAYLRNMRVGASMSVSLVQNGKLWGLVACHHPHAHTVTPVLRRSCVLLAQIAVARFSLIGEAEVVRPSVAAKAAVARLMHDSLHGADSGDLLHRDMLLRNSQALLGLPGASGMVLSSNGAVVSLGDVPAPVPLSRILAWIAGRGPELLVTDHLAALYPEVLHPEDGGLAGVAGLLAMPLSGTPENVIVWFRPEVARTVTWAGDPVKPAGALAGGDRLTPRSSFEAWSETVGGRSRPWTNADAAAANSLRDALVAIIVRRSADIQRMNAQLRQSNEELQSFAYVASHDLKDPLRQIEIFASLLQRAHGRTPRWDAGDSPERIEHWFAGISASSRRLRNLIDHLAGYARLGSDACAFAPADLGELLAAVLQDFAGALAEAGGVVEVSPLPVITCDATQIWQVLQNLVSNAIKYRHADRPLLLRISASQLPATGATGSGDVPSVVLRVEDNGIGFADRHGELIFKPFERLHRAEEYDGSGLGLAICRRVVDRHGGSITATSHLGEGSVFTVTLPIRPLHHKETAAA